MWWRWARCGCSRPSGGPACSAASIRLRRARCSAARPPPQSETTLFHPRSPYACAKVYAHRIHRELSRELWPACLLRHPVQPRVAAAGRNLRHPQDHPRGGADPAWAAGQALPGQPGGAPRLGLRRRLRGGHVADAAAGRARTITSSPPAKRTPCASSWKRLSPTPGWTGGST